MTTRAIDLPIINLAGGEISAGKELVFSNVQDFRCSTSIKAPEIHFYVTNPDLRL